MNIVEIGREGENLARDFIKKLGCDEIFQADWMIKVDGKWCVIEVKNQERFKAPTFDGHGLPVWQVKARMKFYSETGIRCKLLVFDRDEKNIYEQWLDILEQGEHFDTGTSRRRVYPITSYNKVGEWEPK